MRILRDTALMYQRKLLETLRAPAWIVVGLTAPLLYLVLFAPLLHNFVGGPGFPTANVLDVFVPGILALMAFSAGTGAGWIVIHELDTGVIERFRVTPVSRLAMLMGTVLRDVTMFVLPAILVIVVAIPFGYHPSWPAIPLLLLLLCLVTAATSATSSALGLTLREIGPLAAIVTGLTLPLTLLSGVLLPLSLAPIWMQTLAYANPLYYAVEASRALSAGDFDGTIVFQAWAVLFALVLVVLTWATRTYQRAVR